MKMTRRPNRLIHETSPYLLQHAYNPVDWYSWGEEAFEKARQENKPILLSIGYSACHWCHVMERESFENEEIAAIMNKYFVNIKVDREERPDIDQIYQIAVQLFMKRGGGWPLTMFLTPDQVPFYGGTYFPPDDIYDMPGFRRVLEEVAAAYREDISKTVSDIQKTMKHYSEEYCSHGRAINPDIVSTAVKELSHIFDSKNGGFGSAPKFPCTSSLALFLRHAQQAGDATDSNKVAYTLEKMALGGIYDQLGGGFHRYSTDSHWLVPHFEKMLYDNAQLAQLYFWTYQVTGQIFYKKIGIEILDYVLREMTDPLGGFYSTQDADSEGEEGLFFVWTDQEIKKILGENDGEIISRYYNTKPEGNFEGKNILHVQRSVDEVASEVGLTSEETLLKLRSGKEKLFLEREKRPKPFRDEKILTSLNSLMIGAFVQGYNVTRDKKYLTAAKNATCFIMENLYKDKDKEGRLMSTFKDGTVKLNGYLDDYAYFIDALIDLFEATSNMYYLDAAKKLSIRLIDQFCDENQGGFFFTSNDHEKLITRNKTCMDQSIPSGNAIAAHAFLRLFTLVQDRKYFDVAEKTLQIFSKQMEENPFFTGNLIAAADMYLRKPKEIVIVGNIGSTEMENLVAKIHSRYIPNKIMVVVDMDNPLPLDLVKGKIPVDGKPTVYICQNNTCSLPLTDWEIIEKFM